jgi:hypothetical protein
MTEVLFVLNLLKMLYPYFYYSTLILAYELRYYYCLLLRYNKLDDSKACFHSKIISFLDFLGIMTKPAD